MEKLKLEEVTPYLPYGLRIFDIKSSKKYELIPYKRQYERLDKKMTIQEYMNFNIIDCKPILRPLSDFYNRKRKNGLTDYDFLSNENSYAKFFMEFENIDLENIPTRTYRVIVWLLKQHYDVSGLIEKGLAIDINTIKS